MSLCWGQWDSPFHFRHQWRLLPGPVPDCLWDVREREEKRDRLLLVMIDIEVTVAAPAACLVFWRRADVHAIEPAWERCRGQGEGEESCLQTGPRLWSVKAFESPFSSHCPEKSKAGCTGSCSESVPSATGVLTGVLLEGCVPVFSWDWEEDDEEWVLSLELLRVSVLVLVFFIFLLFASGALSTVCRRKPSRLHLLNAWERKRKQKLIFEFVIKIFLNLFILQGKHWSHFLSPDRLTPNPKVRQSADIDYWTFIFSSNFKYLLEFFYARQLEKNQHQTLTMKYY